MKTAKVREGSIGNFAADEVTRLIFQLRWDTEDGVRLKERNGRRRSPPNKL
ncbi:MAG: hypothetical protein ACI8V5_001395 [Limisphaerales bacterium]|jgi:hypothetical protein